MVRRLIEADYSQMWVSLYEDIVRNGVITRTTGYPCMVNGRYIIATTPIPRWDCPPLHQAENLSLFGAGREKRIYAIPPHTDVVPLTFDDVAFQVEHTPGVACSRCGSGETFLVESPSEQGSRWACSDTDWCNRNAATGRAPTRPYIGFGVSAPTAKTESAPLADPVPLADSTPLAPTPEGVQ